jgi:hypothetical protein
MDPKRKEKGKGEKTVIEYNLNPSTQLLAEDYLKKCLVKYGGNKTLSSLRSKNAPKCRQSPFGDFPSGYLPLRTQDFTLVNIDSHQVAHSVNGASDRGTKSKPFSKSSAFSSLSKKTTDRPPVAGAFKSRKIAVSDFRLHYDRGDLPIHVEHEMGTKIKWMQKSFDNFNFQYYLPIFVDGIREKDDPYRFLSIHGTFDLLANVGDKIIKIIPQLILPIKAALNTRDTEVIVIALKVSKN